MTQTNNLTEICKGKHLSYAKHRYIAILKKETYFNHQVAKVTELCTVNQKQIMA